MTEGFYVSMIAGKRKILLYGPFDEHQQALDSVSEARNKACEVDPACHFNLFGTCKVTAKKLPSSLFGT